MSSHDLERAKELAGLSCADSLFWAGYAAGLEGQDLMNAIKTLAERREGARQKRPLGYRNTKETFSDFVFPKTASYYDAPKIRGILWSLILAFTVSYTLSSVIIASFWLALGLVHPNGLAYVFSENYSKQWFFALILPFVLMVLESISWGSIFVTFMCARTIKSFRTVLMRALFTRRGAQSGVGPIIIRN